MRTNFEPYHQAATERIFVVESDEVVRSALQFILNHQHGTHGFKGLDQALTKAADSPPDVVLLGIGLVQKGGERVLGEIVSRLPATRILVVADTASDPLARKCLKWGAHDVLGKPISFESVHCKVDALLKHHEISPALLGLLPQSAAW